MDFECPHCKEEFEIEFEDLPLRASDDTQWKCPNCKKKTMIGWFATVEER